MRGFGFGFGFETTDRVGANGLDPEGAYGWAGAYGSLYRVDPDAIARAVEWALDHRDELAVNARDAVAAQFTIDKMAEATAAVKSTAPRDMRMRLIC